MNEQNLRLVVQGHKENCHVVLYDSNVLLGSVTAARASEILIPEIAKLVLEAAKDRL